MVEEIKLYWDKTNENILKDIIYTGKRNFGEWKNPECAFKIKFSEDGTGFSDGVLRVNPNTEANTYIKIDNLTKEELIKLVMLYNSAVNKGANKMKEITNTDELKQLYKDIESLEKQCVEHNKNSDLLKINECINNFNKLYENYFIMCNGKKIQLYMYSTLMRFIWEGKDSPIFNWITTSYIDEYEKIIVGYIKQLEEDIYEAAKVDKIHKFINNVIYDFISTECPEIDVKYFSIYPKILKLKELLSNYNIETKNNGDDTVNDNGIRLLNWRKETNKLNIAEDSKSKKRKFIELARDVIKDNTVNNSKISTTLTAINERQAVIEINKNTLNTYENYKFSDGGLHITVGSTYIEIYYNEHLEAKYEIMTNGYIVVPIRFYKTVQKAFEKVNTKYNKIRKEGTEYYYIDSCDNVVKEKEGNRGIDDDRFKIGNYFNSIEDAEIYKLAKHLTNII